MLTDRLARLTLALVIGIWVARHLGPDQFGLLSFALAITSVLAAFASTGIDSLVVRELVDRPDSRREVLGTAAALRLTGAIVGMTLACVVALLLRPHDPLVLWLVAVAALGFLFQPIEVIDLLFQANMTPRKSVIARLIAYAIGAMVRVALILNDASVLAFAIAHVLETALAALGLLVSYKLTEPRRVRWRMAQSTAFSLFREGWPLAASMLVIATQSKIDHIMLGQLAGDREVGIYGAAARVTEAFIMIPYTIILAAVPALARKRNEAGNNYGEAFDRLCASLVGGCYLAAIAIALAADPIIRILFGARYADSGPVLAIHIWTLLFVSLITATSHYLVLERSAHLTLYRTAFGCALSFVLNLILIPRFGALGAAWATLIAYAGSTLAIFDRRQGSIVVRTMLSSLLLLPLFRRSSSN